MRTFQIKATLPLLGLLLLTGCCTSRSSSRSWEYRVATVQAQSPPRSGLEEYLNSHAPEGWVLAQFVESGGGWVVVTKRLKAQ